MNNTKKESFNLGNTRKHKYITCARISTNNQGCLPIRVHCMLHHAYSCHGCLVTMDALPPSAYLSLRDILSHVALYLVHIIQSTWCKCCSYWSQSRVHTDDRSQTGSSWINGCQNITTDSAMQQPCCNTSAVPNHMHSPITIAMLRNDAWHALWIYIPTRSQIAARLVGMSQHMRNFVHGSAMLQHAHCFIFCREDRRGRFWMLGQSNSIKFRWH